jgi:hypothetical protein
MTKIHEHSKPIKILQNSVPLHVYLYTPVTNHCHYNRSFTPTSLSHWEALCRLVWKAQLLLPAGKNSRCRLREGNQRDTLTSNKRICEFLSFLRHSGTRQYSPFTHQNTTTTHTRPQRTNPCPCNKDITQPQDKFILDRMSYRQASCRVKWNYSCIVLE